MSNRPTIVLLVDKPNWVFDFVANSVAARLADSFDFRIEYVSKEPNLGEIHFDLLYVFFWGEGYHRQFNFDTRKVIKEISSHRWQTESQYGLLTATEMNARYLSDAGHVTSTSKRICAAFAGIRTVTHLPNGFDKNIFFDGRRRSGPLVIGWAGNEDEPYKGLVDVLRPACEGRFHLSVAGGKLATREAMADFYNSVDVITVASVAEGQPLTLVEGMACGCFPVAVDVGIVPEIIESGKNGIVVNRDIGSFQEAFGWCEANLAEVRRIGAENASKMLREREWSDLTNNFRQLFSRVIAENSEGRTDYREHLLRTNGTNWDAGLMASRTYYDAEVLSVLPSDRDAMIVDVGSGLGYFVGYLLGRGYRKVGCIDLSRRLLDDVKNRFGGRLWFAETVDALSFFRSTQVGLDFVSMIDVIEHFPLQEAQELVALVYNSLNPGGILLLRTPNMANILASYSRYMDLTHHHGYTDSSLRQVLELGGFDRVDFPEGRPIDDPRRMRNKWINDSLHRLVYRLHDRTMPRVFDKNIVMYGKKGH